MRRQRRATAVKLRMELDAHDPCEDIGLVNSSGSLRDRLALLAPRVGTCAGLRPWGRPRPARAGPTPQHAADQRGSPGMQPVLHVAAVLVEDSSGSGSWACRDPSGGR